MKDRDKWNMKNMDLLNEKDLTCIARILQSAIYADSLYYLCGCCQHKEDCFDKTKKIQWGYHFLKVREKLQKITGIELSVFNNKSAESIRKKIQSENKKVSEKTAAVDSVDKTIESVCDYVQKLADKGFLGKHVELIKALAELVTARNSQLKIDAAISNVGEMTENFKLTNQEREFCEVIRHGYIARDQDGILRWHDMRPIKFEKEWIKGMDACRLYGDIFDFVKWEDAEPWNVEELLAE